MQHKTTFQEHGHQDTERPVRRIIGLTGGIGMGKTTVSQYLASVHHLPVLDADIYARDAVAAGSPIFHEIVDRYGRGILLEDGQLDRRRLGNIIFKNPSERLWLEQRIHPYVRDRFQEVLAMDHQSTTMVLVIPLLFEARMNDLVTEIWVISTPREIQVERLLQREASTSAEVGTPDLEAVQARIDSQMPIGRKIAAADVVLDNTATLEALYAQVDQALTRASLHQSRTVDSTK